MNSWYRLCWVRARNHADCWAVGWSPLDDGLDCEFDADMDSGLQWATDRVKRSEGGCGMM
jgi:hypothetical protein